ncbi:MAG: hypothetical protein Q9179_004764 [Wetmoreana sp. 5 TL-2023]
MKYGLDQNSRDLQLEKVRITLLVLAPIVFVAHSMGGLVVKKACILSQNNDQYRQIFNAVRVVFFLSTPHRGADSAALLNNILAVSIFGSSKQYIAELKPNSLSLQDINEQFRHIAPDLRIFSFFETQQTTIGPRKIMVLEASSSILGYSNEVHEALDADHHNVCKYVSRQDPNYIDVRNAMRAVIRDLSHANLGTHVANLEEGELKKLQTLLAVSDAPEDDLEHFRSRWTQGTCEWILSHSTFLSWLENNNAHPHTLWLNGLPGCGKSVLSAFLIRRLQDMGRNCHYYFFRFGDHTKRTVSNMLRSIAYQIALKNVELRTQLQKLADDAVKLEKADERVIWQKIFVSRLCRLEIKSPMYWIVDALDECDDPQKLLNSVSSVSASLIPLRILFVGRETQILSIAFQRMESFTQIRVFPTIDTNKDVERHVEKEVKLMHGDPQLKVQIKRTVCDMANGNFLWVHLVLEELIYCHTEAAITQSLRHLPSDLKSFYQRMAFMLWNTSRPEDRGLSKTILTWVICSQRALTLDELNEGLKPEFNVLDLRLTIRQVCRDFVVVDTRDHVIMLHQTARDYLIENPDLDHAIVPGLGHHELFKKCITYLPSPHPSGGNPPSEQPLLHYAAIHWAYHLGLSTTPLDRSTVLALSQFFQSTRVLAWIHLLATENHLASVIYTSQIVTTYVRKRSKSDAGHNPQDSWTQYKRLFELWAIDLAKLVGKYGVQLVRYPTAIYALVPALCPTNSVVHQQFGRRQKALLNLVAGFSRQSWDDCLSRLSVGRKYYPLRIECLDQHFVVLTSDGTLCFYDSTTSQLSKRLVHGERVVRFKVSISNEKCVTWGLHTTKVWHIESGRQVGSIRSPLVTRACDLTFSNDESAIILWSSATGVRRFTLEASEAVWQPVHCDLDFDSAENIHYGSPNWLAFNADGTRVAVAFRGSPSFVWDIGSASLVSRCVRASDKSRKKEHPYTDVGPICWNPVTGHVLGVYAGRLVFKWYPSESDSQEIQAIACDIRCSPGGGLFVTSDKQDTLKVWNFHQFSLIYQLSSHTSIRDMALSPNGRRIYDLRGTFCNIWEPDALVRLVEVDEETSEMAYPNTESLQQPGTNASCGPNGGRVPSGSLSLRSSPPQSALPGTSLVARSHILPPDTELPITSEEAPEVLELMTALAVGSRTTSYCLGDDAGNVRLRESSDETFKHVFQGFGPIQCITRNDDETCLVIADCSGDISVRLQNTFSLLRRRSLVPEAQLSGGIQQLLLSSSSEYLLIQTKSTTELWSLSDRILITKKSNTYRFGQWTNHPEDRAYLVYWAFNGPSILRWSDLEENTHFRVTVVPQADSERDQRARLLVHPLTSYSTLTHDHIDSLDTVLMLEHGCHVMLQVSSPADNSCRFVQYLIISTESLHISGVKSTVGDGILETAASKILGVRGSLRPTDEYDVIEAQPVPFAVATEIERVLGLVDKTSSRRRQGYAGEGNIQFGEILAFIDHDNWICSWVIAHGPQMDQKIRRHFFIPQDWLNLDGLRLATVSRNGTFYCPRHGQVAVVSDWLDYEWTEEAIREPSSSLSDLV